MAQNKGWRDVKVLVTIPVRGPITNKRVVSHVEDAISTYHADLCSQSEHGRWRVKDFARAKRYIK